MHIFIEGSRFILLLKQRNDMKHLRGVLSRICWQNKPGLKRNSNLFNNKTWERNSLRRKATTYRSKSFLVRVLGHAAETA